MSEGKDRPPELQIDESKGKTVSLLLRFCQSLAAVSSDKYQDVAVKTEVSKDVKIDRLKGALKLPTSASALFM